MVTEAIGIDWTCILGRLHRAPRSSATGVLKYELYSNKYPMKQKEAPPAVRDRVVSYKQRCNCSFTLKFRILTLM